MIETKSIKVSTSDEQSAIDEMQCFGWELKSSQEINVKDSHLEKGTFTDTIYSVTTSEHYVKLVFSRDTAMSNYSRISYLENEYYTLVGQKPVKPAPFRFLVAFVLLWVAIAPGVLYIVFKIIGKTKYKKAYNEWNEKFTKRGREIFTELNSLV